MLNGCKIVNNCLLNFPFSKWWYTIILTNSETYKQHQNGHDIEHYRCHELWLPYCNTCTLFFITKAWKLTEKTTTCYSYYYRKEENNEHFNFYLCICWMRNSKFDFIGYLLCTTLKITASMNRTSGGDLSYGIAAV